VFLGHLPKRKEIVIQYINEKVVEKIRSMEFKGHLKSKSSPLGRLPFIFFQTQADVLFADLLNVDRPRTRSHVEFNRWNINKYRPWIAEI
jgi:hypothetical protein